ncbi:MAG: hypothetical protein PHV68_06275 [Candidatus Gastranaerophilales bacterium]|nr:hypothetical protein [Candidatus Gastranaerophilales bacterium]
MEVNSNYKNEYDFLNKKPLTSTAYNEVANSPALENQLGTDVIELKSKNKELINKIDELDKKALPSFSAITMGVLSTLAPVRKITSTQTELKDGNTSSAIGFLTLGIANLPQDYNDVRSSCLWMKNKNYMYNYKEYQHQFSFFKDTLFEKGVNKLNQNKQNFIKEHVYKRDLPLYKSRLGDVIKSAFNVEIEDSIKNSAFKYVSGKEVPIYKIKSSSKLGRLVGEALLRTPKLSVYALALLEMPRIMKSFAQKGENDSNIENGTKQTVKSGVKLASIFTGMGLLGAKLAKINPVLGLIGTGAGSLAGAYVSTKIDTVIDKM